MIVTLPDPSIYTLAGVAVAILGGLRFYYGPKFNDVPWAAIRPVLVPLVHTLAERKLGEDYYAENRAKKSEYVATLDLSPDAVIDELEAAGYVFEPLAGLKTDWEGRTEVASLARHHGDRLFPGAPSWLKERQVHVTLFETEDGRTVVTAHDEANSWRPDLIEDHYRGLSMDVEAGVQAAADDLRVGARPAQYGGRDEP